MSNLESFETQTSGWDETTFVRFCNALLHSIAARHYGPRIAPRFTSRTKVPDEGLDATIRIEDLTREVSGGVVGPGLSGYQYKKSDSRASRKKVLAEVHKDLKRQIPKIRQRHPDLRRYVILTNQDLGPPNSPDRLRLEEAVVGLWGNSAPAVRLLGSEEIGAFRADYPAVFESFGPDSAFETNEQRLATIESLWKPFGAPKELFARDAERAVVRQFLEAEGGGVLLVTGPPGSGKTFLLARTLSDLPEWEGKTVWKRRPNPVELRGEITSLLSPGRLSTVVVDEIETRDQARQAVTACLEREDLKSIILLRKEHTPAEPAARILDLAPFTHEESRVFLDALKISDHRLREWIEHRAAGIPGVMLKYTALRDSSPYSLGEEEILQKIDASLLEVFLPEANLQRMVAWLALRRQVDLENLSESDHAFAEFVCLESSDPVLLETHAGVLADRGIVKKVGTRVRFEAPFLLGSLVAPFYLQAGERLSQLLVRTPPADWARLLERLESEREKAPARRLAGQLMDASGPFFLDLKRLQENASLFVAAGRILPQQAAERAQQTFTTSLDELKGFLSSPESWEVLEFLRHCFEEAGAEIPAVQALIEATLADGPGAIAGRLVAERYLLPLWSRLHWFDIGIPLSSRLDIVKELADATDVSRRKLAVRACEWAVSRWVLEVRSPSDRMSLPGAQRPQLPWAEVRQYFEGAARLLRKLMADSDEDVASSAIEVLESNFRELLSIGISPEEIRETVDSLVRRARIMRRFDRVRSVFALGLEDLSELVTQSEESNQWRTAVASLLKSALDSLDPRDGFPVFQDELRDVFAERHSNRLRSLWSWSASPSGRFEANEDPLRRRAVRAAELVASDPSKISDELLGFLASDQAVFAWLFWRLVGQLDVRRHWRERLIGSNPERFAGAFADYAAGWTSVSAGEADDFLDELAADPAKHAFVFAATWKQPPTPRRALRIRKIADSGEIPRDRIAGTLEWGAWAARLGEKEALPILRTLAGHIEDVDARPLLRLLDSCFRFEAAVPFGELTKQLAWEVLERTAAANAEGLTDEQQTLAATLVLKGDVDRGFAFIRKRLEDSAGRAPAQTSSLRSLQRWPQLRVALAEADRERFVRLWLEYVLRLPPGWQSLVSGEGVVDPIKDGPIVMELVGSDPERTSAVFATLSGNEPGFLDLARAIIDRTPEDPRLWRDIAWRFAYGDVIWGPISEHLDHKLTEIRQSVPRNADSARWQRWAAFAIEDLMHRRSIEENWEFTRGFWDGKPTTEEACSILERPAEDPKRRWLIRRLLENEKATVARKILGEEEIREAIENDEELDPKVASRWRLLVKGAPAWKS